MANTWLLSGLPENWITAMGMHYWGVNTQKQTVGYWQQIRPGDLIVFHATIKTGYKKVATKSCIVGFSYVRAPVFTKDEYWWIQEHDEDHNKWPHIVPLGPIYTFSSPSDILFDIPLWKKSDDTIRKEILLLEEQALSIDQIQQEAKAIDPAIPNIFLRGSIFPLRDLYKSLVIGKRDKFLLPGDSHDPLFMDDLDTVLIHEATEDTSTKLLEKIRAFDNSNKPSHKTEKRERKVRLDDEGQKKRVAAIEKYTCQVCGFKESYIKKNGNRGYIIDIDHINPKEDKNNEHYLNLWVLCPNCHRKKGAGIITIDVANQKVYERGKEIPFSDNHLFVK